MIIANVLDLNNTPRFVKCDTRCKLNGSRYEDLVHFLVRYEELRGDRDKELMEEREG